MASALIATAEALASYCVHRHPPNKPQKKMQRRAFEDSSAIQTQLLVVARQAYSFVEDLLDHLVEDGVQSSSPRFADAFTSAYQANFGISVDDAWARSSLRGDQHRRDKAMLLCSRKTYLKRGLKTRTVAEYILVDINKSVTSLAQDVQRLVTAFGRVLRYCDDGKVSAAQVVLHEANWIWNNAADLPVNSEAYYCLPIEQDAFPPWAASWSAWSRPFPEITPDAQPDAAGGDDNSSQLPTVWGHQHNLDSDDTDDAGSNSSADSARSTWQHDEEEDAQRAQGGDTPPSTETPGLKQTCASNVSKSIENLKENFHQGFVVDLCRMRSPSRQKQHATQHAEATSAAATPPAPPKLHRAVLDYINGRHTVGCEIAPQVQHCSDDLDHAIQRFQNSSLHWKTDHDDLNSNDFIDLDAVMPVGPTKCAAPSVTGSANPPSNVSALLKTTSTTTTTTVSPAPASATVSPACTPPSPANFDSEKVHVPATISAGQKATACIESQATFQGYLVRTGLHLTDDLDCAIRLGTSKVAKAISYFESQQVMLGV